MSPHGVHAKDQTAFRFPPGVLPRLKARAEAEGRTMTDIVVEVVTGYLDQRDGITTAPVSPPPKRKARADTAPAATFRQPQAPTTPAAVGSEPEGASDIAAFFRRRNGGQQ